MSRLARTRFLVSTAAALSLVSMSGCGGARPTAATGATTFDGEWQLVSGTLDGTTLSVPASWPITLVIDRAEVSGRSACNAYSGALDTDGESLRITGLGGTDMACEPAVMALESAYRQALSLVERAGTPDGTLVLTGGGAELSYEPISPATDASLAGTHWVLESIIEDPGSDGTVSSTTAAADLRFDDDGTFAGSTGCGPVVGIWQLVDGRVETTLGDPPAPPADIRPAPCAAEAAAQHESVVAVLSGPFTATVSDDLLTLTAEDGAGLGYRAQPADAADDPAT